MRRLVIIALKAALWAFLALWLAYTGAYFKFNDATLGEFITRKVGNVERGQFILKHARYPYWGGLASIVFNTPAHAVGEDFTLLDPDGNPVIRVPVAYADVHIQELVVSLAKTAFTGGHHFFLTLHFPRAYIPTGWAVIAPTRSTWGHEKPDVNIVAAMSAKHKVESTGAFVIRVDEVELGDVGFAMGFSAPDGKVSWLSKLDGVHAKAGLLYSSEHALATAEGPYFFFRLWDIKTPKGALQLGDDVTGYHFPLEQVTAAEFGVHGDVRQTLHFAADGKTLGATVHAEGALLDAYSEHPGVRLTLDVVNGRGPLALLPAPLSTWLSGDPRARIGIAGPFSHPVIDGEVHEIDANLEGIKLTDGDAKLHFDEGKLAIHPANGKLARGQASADIDFDLGTNAWNAIVTLKGVDPAEIPKLPRAAAVELAGKLDAKVRLAGNTVHHRERIELSRLAAQLSRNKGGGHLPRTLTLAGDGVFTPAAITLKHVTASGEGVSVGADGTVDPRSGRVDAALSIDAAAGSSLFARWGAPSGLRVEAMHAAGHISGALLKPTLSLHAVATNVSFERRMLEKLEADLSLRGGTLVVSDLRGSGLGATSIMGAAELGLFDGGLDHPKATPTVSAQLIAHGLSVAALTGWIAVNGQADVDVDLEGALAHPHGRASLTLPRLEIQGDVYTDGAFRLAFDDEGASVTELSLHRAHGGDVGGSGRIGWNGDMDLRLQPRNFPLVAIPWVKTMPVALAGTLSGDMHVGGTIDRPMPGGILSLVAFKVREVLLGKGDLKMDPGSDAIHLSGKFFDNLVSVDGWLTLVPKVSVSATITVKNLPLEKLVPELQSVAEIHGLATGAVSFTLDTESGLTFAKLDLTQLTLTLTSTDENGRPQRLVVKNMDPVQATFDGTSINIKQANLYSRIGEFTMHGTVGKVNNVYMKGQIGLELLEYFFRGLFEHTHGPATVELTISGDLARPDVTGYVKIGSGKGGAAELIPRGLDGKLTLVVPSGRVDITPEAVSLTNVVVSTERGKEAHASGRVALDHWEPGAISASIQGDISPRLFQWGLPEQVGDASGGIALDVQVGGQWRHPTWHGTATVKDLLFRARKLQRDIRFDGGTVTLDNFDVDIGCPRAGAARPGCQSLHGSINDDQHLDRIDGRVSFGDGMSLRAVDIWLDGSEIAYAQPGWEIKISPRVELVGNGQQLTLKGNIDVVEGRYAQNFDLAGMIFTPKRTNEVTEPFWQGIPLIETMRLNLRAQSRSTLYVKNNIADLPLTANLDVSGTLSEPRLDGEIILEEGGRLTPPGFRYAFDTDKGQVTFARDKKIPDETPTIDLSASTTYIDNQEQSHTLILKLTGRALSPNVDLTSTEGWTRAQVASVLLFGQSPDEFRKITQGAPTTVAPTQTGTATDTIAKTLTGATVGQIISDPLRRQFGLDVVNLQFGGSSVQLDACKRLTRAFKACGQGEIGFTGSSRFGGSVEVRVTDRPAELSGVGRIEYNTHGVDTLQDSLTAGRGELRLKIPLGY